jgi:hypothetical protein
MASQTPDGTTVTPDNGRNPYEMRFDLLHLAKDILEQNAHMAREDIRMKKAKAQDRKTFFTTDEVIETAQKLNGFVSNR